MLKGIELYCLSLLERNKNEIFVVDDSFIVWQIFDILKRNSGNIATDGYEELLDFIDRKLDEAEIMMGDYEEKEVPSDVQEVHDKILDVFEDYFDGFTDLGVSIEFNDVECIRDAIEIIYQADLDIHEIMHELKNIAASSRKSKLSVTL
jgi:hypothetical protein